MVVKLTAAGSVVSIVCVHDAGVCISSDTAGMPAFERRR